MNSINIIRWHVLRFNYIVGIITSQFEWKNVKYAVDYRYTLFACIQSKKAIGYMARVIIARETYKNVGVILTSKFATVSISRELVR